MLTVCLLLITVQLADVLMDNVANKARFPLPEFTARELG